MSEPQVEVNGYHLTQRQLDVLQLLAGEGLNNRLIARRLYVTEDTVKTHLRRVFKAIGARDRWHATVLAYQLGLVDPPGITRPEPPPAGLPCETCIRVRVVVDGHRRIRSLMTKPNPWQELYDRIRDALGGTR